MTTPKFDVGAKVRVRPGADIFAGLVGTVVAYDETHKRPYAVLEDGAAGRPERHFAEDEIERAPIETKVVEGVAAHHPSGFVAVGGLIVSPIYGVEDGDEVRVIVEVLKRGGR
jgi:hypothetical protein